MATRPEPQPDVINPQAPDELPPAIQEPNDPGAPPGEITPDSPEEYPGGEPGELSAEA